MGFSGTYKFLKGHTFCGGLLLGKSPLWYLVTLGWPALTLRKFLRFLGLKNFLDGHTFCGGLLWGKSSLWYLVTFGWPALTLRKVLRFLGLRKILDGHTFCGGLLWWKLCLIRHHELIQTCPEQDRKLLQCFLHLSMNTEQTDIDLWQLEQTTDFEKWNGIEQLGTQSSLSLV